MRAICIIILVTAFSLTALAQAPAWQNIRSFMREDGYSGTVDIHTDADKNIIVGGFFTGSNLSIDSISLHYRNGSYNLFLAKFDSLENLLWAKSGNAGILSSHVDPQGNIIVLVGINDSLFIYDNDTIVNFNHSPLAIIKFNSSGLPQWSQFPAKGRVSANSVAIDGMGNIYVAGSISGDTATIGHSDLINTGLSNVFLAKFDSTGNELWVKTSQGPGDCFINGITTDRSGSIFACGIFDVYGGIYGNYLTFGHDTLRGQGTGGRTAFLVKLDTAGNFLWAKTNSRSGTHMDHILIDSSDNIYVAGDFIGLSVSFDSIVLASNTGYAAYVSKYNNSGNILWAKSVDGLNIDATTNAADKNIVIAGYFFDTLSFANTTFIRGVADDSFHYYNGIVCDYSIDGVEKWAKSTQGEGRNSINRICADKAGDIFVSGYFNSRPIRFDSITLSGASGAIYAFLGKLSSGISTGISSYGDLYHCILLYPNPSNGTIFLKNIRNQDNIEVYDLQGKIIYRKSLDQSTQSINIENTGVYFYRITCNGKLAQTGKLILE